LFFLLASKIKIKKIGAQVTPPPPLFSFVYLYRPQVSSALFFSYNTALGPPYRVLVDTNFINFSIQNKVSV
jgi:hypothetical protein